MAHAWHRIVTAIVSTILVVQTAQAQSYPPIVPPMLNYDGSLDISQIPLFETERIQNRWYMLGTPSKTAWEQYQKDQYWRMVEDEQKRIAKYGEHAEKLGKVSMGFTGGLVGGAACAPGGLLIAGVCSYVLGDAGSKWGGRQGRNVGETIAERFGGIKEEDLPIFVRSYSPGGRNTAEAFLDPSQPIVMGGRLQK